MAATGFSNAFTSGEISQDAWDRVDIQPVAKGCEEATNYVIRIAGPLAKRRGFWDIAPVADEEKAGNLVPFRRSVDDALMLEFGDETVRVWQADGSPLMDGPDQVTFVSPYTSAQLDGLRFTQVGDVIYLRHRDGLIPRTLVRNSNTDWAFNEEVFKNGPWRPENTDDDFTLATDRIFAEPITITASKDLFLPEHVGARFRLRGRSTGAGMLAWAPSFDVSVGYALAISNGRIYRITSDAGLSSNVDTGTNPPVHDRGIASDGVATWEYMHDGGGILEITAVTDSTHAEASVIKALPTEGTPEAVSDFFQQSLHPGDDPALPATPFWAEGAYSNYRGWPRMWPAVKEERLVEGATAANLDFLDLTTTAGFTPTTEDFTPGLGTGLVTDVDAVRRRIGTGAEILWAVVATYLVVGTRGGEFLVGGSVLDEPISPASVLVKQLSEFGSEDVFPARAHKGLIWVARGGKTLRELAVDAAQGVTTDDLTVLARHIGDRGFAQLAWVPQPDETLWCRLQDSGLAVLTYHSEQQVRGWSGQKLADGAWIAEDLAVLPGPGGLETLWAIVTRVKDGTRQRRIWQQSQATDQLFMDCAAFYEGDPVATIGGLDVLEGETVRVLADGAQYDKIVAGGEIALTVPASKVLVGLKYTARFVSLELDTGGLGGLLGLRQRVTAVIVRLLTALARVGLDGGLFEKFSTRERTDIPAASPKRRTKDVGVAGDTSRENRIVIEDDTAYDHVIYSLRPRVTPGA